MKNKVFPFLLKPVGKDYIWGGERLNNEYGKNLDVHPLAETWECSTHPDGVSIVASGDYEGMNLAYVLRAHPEYLGCFANSEGELPVLVKLIDANQDLSVQVHPDDAYAKKFENGQNGKNEMWYVLDSEPGSSLIYGFTEPVSKTELREYLEQGTIESHLQKIPVKKGDTFYIQAGTVHAIGSGLLIAEIQQSSNLTYRLFDYNRTDSEGRKRELHIDKAIDVIDMHPSVAVQQKNILSEKSGYVKEEVCSCPYFNVERIEVDTDLCDAPVTFDTFEQLFQIFLCINGKGKINFGESDHLLFSKGDCIFIPAGSCKFDMDGCAEILCIKSVEKNDVL